ncbi:MAG: PD-(D/E)XK nuclease family protein [Deltaproteobacteria bacterium]|nr:PD-(D/E)XK nuclease family protein [Deltaproteobacteria bacterium]
MRKVKIEGLIDAIKGGAVVLTVNTRLSRYLSAEYDLAMKEAGASFWHTPQILPFSSWVESLWVEAGDAPLLGALRSKVLWDSIVSKDAVSGEILLPGGASDESWKAYSILKEYNLRLPEDDIYLTEEARALKRWVRSYEAGVRDLGFVERHTLGTRVLGLINVGRITPPENIVLAGFDEVTPKSMELVDGLKGKGVKVLWWPDEPGATGELPDLSGRVAVRAYRDESVEVEQAARWARTVAGPGIKVGFIVPELNRYRDLIRREFSAELNPASALPWEDKRDLFNISLGAALSDEPLVRSAIAILSVGEGKEELEKISPVLHSPFFSGERLSMTLMDAMLKKDNCIIVTLNDLRRRGARHSKGLEEKFGLWIRDLRDSPSRQLPGQWAKSFSALLKDLGWLSSVKLTSKEFQALKAWNALLEEFSTLDDITGRLSRAEAASRVAALAADAIHQPKTPGCGVEVVGMLEAAGHYYDHVWVMGCHEFALPAQPSPNPFIPVNLQREKKVPHSSYERELAYAKSNLKRVLECAPSVLVSYPLRSEEKDTLLSPLLKGFESGGEAERVTATSRLKDSVHSAYALTPLVDEPFVPVTPVEAAGITGGTFIIKDQSLCPFKAFATHRLHAAPVDAPEPGMSESDRGRILHTALKVFWERTVDSARLNEILEKGELKEYVRPLADEVFKEAGISDALSPRFIELEKERLERLFIDWAALEAQRGPFRVKHVEMEESITVEGLTIRGRIDRVDETADGEEVIIDYKSGLADRYDWLTSRPREPQLLVYSLSGRFDTISFARLVPGDCRFIGVSRAEGVLPSVKSLDKDSRFKEKAENRDWDSLMEFWKATVSSLAREFLSGYAPVDPNPELKGRKSPCLYCELATLCRIVEVRGAKEEDDDGGE